MPLMLYELYVMQGPWDRNHLMLSPPQFALN